MPNPTPSLLPGAVEPRPGAGQPAVPGRRHLPHAPLAGGAAARPERVAAAFHAGRDTQGKRAGAGCAARVTVVSGCRRAGSGVRKNCQSSHVPYF